MFFKRLNIIILFSCFCFLFSHSEESAGGLLFTSSSEKVDKRTSMCIFGDKLQRIEDSFNISFDLSIWDIKQFGHIFRVINEQKKEVEFVFVNFYGIDNMYLDFHSPITHKSVQIPITRESIERKELLHLDITFDLKEDKASIALNNKFYTCAPVGLTNPSFLQFAFGLYGLNLDVPQMLIRNLRIKMAKDKTRYFPLKESAGEFAYDETGKIKAHVKNPEWIVNKHYYWQKKSTFNVKNNAFVTFDDKNNRILIVTNDSIFSYNPINNTKKGIALTGMPENFNLVDAICDTSGNQCYLFGADSSAISKSIVLTENLTVNYINSSGRKNLLHHNSFFSSNDYLYQFGGYGDHTYSDKLSLFNKENLNWEVVSLAGDKITPRYYSASGDGVHPDEKLIFGGFGNETGKQEHGGHNLYDLYVLNLAKKTISNVWSLNETPKSEFIAGNNLILDKDKTHFYVFCYAHHMSKSIGHLYRFNLKDGSYEIVSDSVHITSEDMNTSVNLLYNKQMNEFYVVVKELSDNKTTIKNYTLLSPPITKSQLENFVPDKRSGLTVTLGALLLVILILAFRFWFFSKKKNVNEKMINISTNLKPFENLASESKLIRQSAVYVFGNFTAFDNKGTDISYRFSMKLKTLFALILLYSSKETGISTEKLTSSMWPDKDLNEAKNIRGVTINRLRSILADMDGIMLVHENSHWHFTFDSNFYCDYVEYSSLINRLRNPDHESYNLLIEQLVAIVSNGGFLLNIQDQIIENYKSNEEEKIEIILSEYIQFLYRDKQYKKIIHTSSVFFAVEPIDEKILDICLKSYNKLGRNDEAKVFLSNYKKTYKMMTGTDYKKSP